MNKQYATDIQCVLPHLSGVSTAGKVRDHIDRRCLIWELDKRLIFVCSDIKLALHKSAEGCAKLSEFLLCGFIRQIPDVEHLHQGPFCWLGLRRGMHSAVKGQSVLPAGCTRHYRYLGWRLCVSVHSVSHDAPEGVQPIDVCASTLGQDTSPERLLR